MSSRRRQIRRQAPQMRPGYVTWPSVDDRELAQFVGLWGCRREDVQDRNAAGNQRIGKQPAVTLPPLRFGAHHRCGARSRERQERSRRTSRNGWRGHVIGIAAEGLDPPGGVDRVRSRPAPAAKIREMLIRNAGALEQRRQGFTRKVRMPPRPGMSRTSARCRMPCAFSRAMKASALMDRMADGIERDLGAHAALIDEQPFDGAAREQLARRPDVEIELLLVQRPRLPGLELDDRDAAVARDRHAIDRAAEDDARRPRRSAARTAPPPSPRRTRAGAPRRRAPRTRVPDRGGRCDDRRPTSAEAARSSGRSSDAADALHVRVSAQTAAGRLEEPVHQHADQHRRPREPPRVPVTRRAPIEPLGDRQPRNGPAATASAPAGSAGSADFGAG